MRSSFSCGVGQKLIVEPVWSPDTAVIDVHGHLLPKFSAHTMEHLSCIAVFGVGISFFRREQKVPVLGSLLVSVRGAEVRIEKIVDMRFLLF